MTEYDRAMTAWRVSPILVPFIDELDKRFPGIEIGTIGDAEHTAEGSGSDHNPDKWGFVCAADPMISPHFTAADAEYVFDRITTMIRAGDKRPAFAIYNKRIISSTVQPGVIRPYTGTKDPHTGHLHISVPHGSDPHPDTTWNIYPKGPALLSPEEIAQVLDIHWGRTNPVSLSDFPNVAAHAAALQAQCDQQKTMIDTLVTALKDYGVPIPS